MTLTGIGGVGKTRLALRIAGEVRTDFPDGVWLVELGELRDESMLVDVVTATLGVRDQSARPPARGARLSSCALVNCCSSLTIASKWSTRRRNSPKRYCGPAREMRILATSREALGIVGEAVEPLSPLPCPETYSEATGLGPGDDAVALFAERAAAAVPGFALTTENMATIAQICSRLDGLPLAIELAAARLRAMSPDQILDRLSDRFTLLTRGSRRAPTRQQTLAWSIGWSYDLCTPDEQQLWGRLSVFSGSFELQAAEEVCGYDMAAEDFLDLVSSLVDKSILLRTEEQRCGPAPVARHRPRLRKGAARADRRKPTTAAATLRLVSPIGARRRGGVVQRRAGSVVGPGATRAVQSAGGVGLQHLRRRSGLRLDFVADLHQFWFLRGPFNEARRWLDRALAGAPNEPTTARARALYAACMIASTQGDIPAATALVAQGRALVQRTADPIAHAAVAIGDGFTALAAGQVDHACACLQDAIDERISPTMRGGALITLGWAQELRGESAPALASYEKALALSESHGESMYRILALLSMGARQMALRRRGPCDPADPTEPGSGPGGERSTYCRILLRDTGLDRR